jgi:anti-anti-sigma factor
MIKAAPELQLVARTMAFHKYRIMEEYGMLIWIDSHFTVRHRLAKETPMKMTAKTRHAGSVTIVDISGRIVLGEECTALGKLMRDLFGKGQYKILLNLADVDRIDTAGLAHIVSGLTSARKHQGDLRLLNPRKHLVSVLEVTRLLSVLDVSHDEAAAVRSFSVSVSQ